jgi:hypothetical protein
MSSLVRLLGGLAVAIAVTLVFLFWIGWPGFLAVAAGGVFGVAFLIVATSLGADASDADRAWRAQAGDLVGAPRTDEPDGSADGPASGEDEG